VSSQGSKLGEFSLIRTKDCFSRKLVRGGKGTFFYTFTQLSLQSSREAAVGKKGFRGVDQGCLKRGKKIVPRGKNQGLNYGTLERLTVGLGGISMFDGEKG